MQLDKDQALFTLCVRLALNAYLKATQYVRKKQKHTQLFLCFGGNKRGEPVSKTRISEWLKMVVAESYVRLGLSPPKGVKGHQVRKQGTSWADAARVDPQKICDAATWRSSSVFVRHYQLDLVHGARADFGRRVLRVVASSSAEASLRRSLGAAPPSSSGLPDGYRIPKKVSAHSTR